MSQDSMFSCGQQTNAHAQLRLAVYISERVHVRWYVSNLCEQDRIVLPNSLDIIPR